MKLILFSSLLVLSHLIAVVSAQVGCETIKCAEGYECDVFNPGCTPVSCKAVDACDKGYVCVPEERFCIRSPCPQFRCDKKRESSGCETSCGETVNPLTFYDDDGKNYCKKCFCLGFGYSFCSPRKSCPEDKEKSICEADPHCYTDCGRRVEVGEGFQDDGANYCNVCSCSEGGYKICTLIACEPNKESNVCGCTSECGRKVEYGVFFTDDGNNNCNQCSCGGDGSKACTKIGCEEEKCTESPKIFCTTTCGKSVAAGLKYQDDGPNMCNYCTCQDDGVATCTEMGCDGVGTCE